MLKKIKSEESTFQQIQRKRIGHNPKINAETLQEQHNEEKDDKEINGTMIVKSSDKKANNSTNIKNLSVNFKSNLISDIIINIIAIIITIIAVRITILRAHFRKTLNQNRMPPLNLINISSCLKLSNSNSHL